MGVDSLSIRLICLNPTISASTTTTSLCPGETATLTATGATNYTWSPIGSTSSTVVVSPTISTNYVLTGSNDGLCFPTTNVSILVTPCVIGIEELTNNNAAVYPNPTKDVLYIDFNSNFSTSTFELTNTIGELVMNEVLEDKNSRINIEKIPTGIYFYQIKNKTSTLKVGKLIKE